MYCNDINAIWKLLSSELLELDKSTFLKKQIFHSLRENIKKVYFKKLI